MLFGSLAKTGKGHRTDGVIEETLYPVKCEVVFDTETKEIPHENTMDLFAYKNGEQIGYMRVLSVGGGDIVIEGREGKTSPDVYPHSTFSDIAEYCKAKNIRLSDYVEEFEGGDIYDFLKDVWRVMLNEIEEGLTKTGVLPGG